MEARQMPKHAWNPIEAHELQDLNSLFEKEPDRLSSLCHEVAGLTFDWSKTHLDRSLVESFTQFAEESGFATARDKLFAGAIVNVTEGRAAEHLAERGSGTPEAVQLATSRRMRMRALVDAIEAGAFGDVSAVLHIGIGGSVLGPELLVDALGRSGARLDLRFLSNIDPQAFTDAVDGLDPATTLIVAVSKTFTTSETMANLSAALDWIEVAGISYP
jgi:glucose-6-phosphate isomerase